MQGCLEKREDFEIGVKETELGTQGAGINGGSGKGEIRSFSTRGHQYQTKRKKKRKGGREKIKLKGRKRDFIAERTPLDL